MREIKFRAWDKTENKMARSVKEMRFNHKGLYAVTLNHMGFEFKRRINDVILEQYTGLKDKNGKEIYEGDKVETRAGECAYGVWEYKGTVIVEDIRCIPEDLARADEFEIIGNIHDEEVQE